MLQRSATRHRVRCRAAIAMALLAFATAASAQQPAIESPTLSGLITEASTAHTLWLGAIDVRLRGVRILDEKAAEALQFMRSLATSRKATCTLTGERADTPAGPLVGRCTIADPGDATALDLGERLIGLGYGRPCAAPQPAPLIWPPVYRCE